MSIRILYIVIGVAIVIGLIATLLQFIQPTPAPVVVPESIDTTIEPVACATDAMQCADGLFVGRTGPKCEFVCPDPTVPLDVQKEIDKKSDLVKVATPPGMTVVTSPIILKGQARGNWFFEASAPVSLVNWDGLIIAEGIITADGEWMTTEFVPFTGSLGFTSPYKDGDPDFMKRGAIIFQKDNPSGLPENDDTLEIPVLFAD
jgi:Immunoglobulin-like domain of bacterial spore germination